MRRMRLRFAGVCRACGAHLAAGTTAGYDADARQVVCADCLDTEARPAGAGAGGSEPATPPVSPLAAGEAGASAGREYERRAARREDRVRERYPRIGGFLLAVSDEPQHITAWQTGQKGEQKLGRVLDALEHHGARVLHDRRIPRSRANIDHIAVSAAGVFVLDAKRYKGRPNLKVEGGILRPRTEILMVGGRNCSSLVEGMGKQLALVRAALQSDRQLGGVPIAGMLVFVDADWPLLGAGFAINGVNVLWPKKAAERIVQPGPLAPDAFEAVHRCLAAAFPVA